MTKKNCKDKKQEKIYVCVVCGKKKKTKAKRKLICCGKEMLSKEKGSWNL